GVHKLLERYLPGLVDSSRLGRSINPLLATSHSRLVVISVGLVRSSRLLSYGSLTAAGHFLSSRCHIPSRLSARPCGASRPLLFRGKPPSLGQADLFASPERSKRLGMALYDR